MRLRLCDSEGRSCLRRSVGEEAQDARQVEDWSVCAAGLCTTRAAAAQNQKWQDHEESTEKGEKTIEEDVRRIWKDNIYLDPPNTPDVFCQS